MTLSRDLTLGRRQIDDDRTEASRVLERRDGPEVFPGLQARADGAISGEQPKKLDVVEFARAIGKIGGHASPS